MSQILFIEIDNKFLSLSEFFLLWLSNTKCIRIHTVFGCSFSLSRECFLNKSLYCENKWLLIPDFSLPVSRLRGFLSFKFTITHYLVPSVIFFFSSSALTTKWTLSGSKTITPALSQIRLPSASVAVKVCQVFDASLLAFPYLHHLTRLTDMLAGYRCWPVVPLFEMCSLCFSLQGKCDSLISLDAHSPGKICEKN